MYKWKIYVEKDIISFLNGFSLFLVCNDRLNGVGGVYYVTSIWYNPQVTFAMNSDTIWSIFTIFYMCFADVLWTD